MPVLLQRQETTLLNGSYKNSLHLVLYSVEGIKGE